MEMYRAPHMCDYYGCKYLNDGRCFNGRSIIGKPDAMIFESDECPKENDKEESIYDGRK